MQSTAENRQYKAPQECKAVSVVSADNAPQLLQLLEGLSGQPGLRLLAHVMWLKGPIIDKMPPKLQLTRSLICAPEKESSEVNTCGSWTVRQEGLPMRGRGVSDLAATVRSVTLVYCNGSDVPKFWHGMGFSTSHEVLQDGHVFTLCLNGMRIKVLLAKLSRLQVCNDLSSKVEVQPGQLFLEVTAMVANEDHIPACKAIGSLGGLIRHICELQKS